jgi:TonB family protein
MRVLAPAALVAVCTLCAQELSHVTPPRIIAKVEPRYSKEAAKAQMEGNVIVFIVIGADGMPRNPKVVRTLGLDLEQSAVAAVSKWQFAPGVKNGMPVDTQAQIEVNFRLAEQTKWHLQRVEFYLQGASERPTIEKVAAPHVGDTALNATATVTFDVGEKGAPVNLRVDKSSDDEWSRNVTEALGKWRFRPASKGGRAVVASCTMDFVRGN